jgi:hypothetical protein
MATYLAHGPPFHPANQPLILPGQWQEVQNLAVKMFEEAPVDRDLRKWSVASCWGLMIRMIQSIPSYQSFGTFTPCPRVPLLYLHSIKHISRYMMIYVHSIKSHQLISNILDIMYIQLNHIEIDNPWYILISTILKHVLYIKSWYFHRVILCFWSGLHWQKGRGICGRSPEGGAICRFFLALKVKRWGKVKEMGQDVGYTHMFLSFFRSEVDQKTMTSPRVVTGFWWWEVGI